MGAIIVGLILIVVGVLLATLLRNKLSNKAVDVQFMKTMAITELKQTFEELAGVGSGDSFRQYVELQGVAATASPAHAPYSKREVAYYSADLIQVYEAEEFFTDDRGHQQSRIVRREDTVSSEKSTEPLLLRDASTGESVTVDLSEGGMQLDLIGGYDRFEAANSMGTSGFFNSFIPRQLGNRTLGYRMKELVIPLGQPLYVLGEAYQRTGELFVGRPNAKEKFFIVSTKDEKQIATEAKRGSIFALVSGIVLSVGGIVVVLMGFVG